MFQFVDCVQHSWNAFLNLVWFKRFHRVLFDVNRWSTAYFRSLIIDKNLTRVWIYTKLLNRWLSPSVVKFSLREPCNYEQLCMWIYHQTKHFQLLTHNFTRGYASLTTKTQLQPFDFHFIYGRTPFEYIVLVSWVGRFIFK